LKLTVPLFCIFPLGALKTLCPPPPRRQRSNIDHRKNLWQGTGFFIPSLCNPLFFIRKTQSFPVTDCGVYARPSLFGLFPVLFGHCFRVLVSRRQQTAIFPPNKIPLLPQDFFSPNPLASFSYVLNPRLSRVARGIYHILPLPRPRIFPPQHDDFPNAPTRCRAPWDPSDCGLKY